MMGSSDYRLDTLLPSSPPFDLIYNSGFNFNLFDNSIESIKPAFDLGQTVFFPPDHPTYPSQHATVLTIPTSIRAPYSVTCKPSLDIMDVLESVMIPHDPKLKPDTTNLVLSLP